MERRQNLRVGCEATWVRTRRIGGFLEKLKIRQFVQEYVAGSISI